MNISEQIQNIIETYETLRTKDEKSKLRSNPEIKDMLMNLENELKVKVASSGFTNINAKLSLGAGNLPRTPITYFRDERVSSTGNEGVYVTLVITPKNKQDDGYVTLNLAQGRQALESEHGKEKSNELLKIRAEKIAGKYHDRLNEIGFETFLDSDELKPIYIARKKFNGNISEESLYKSLLDLICLYTDYAQLIVQPDLEQASECQQPSYVTRSILDRRGQPEFRKKLLEQNYGKCLVTGCPVVNVLEAAHIVPVSDNGDMDVNNGILLRADIHTLFDLFLMGISPDGEIKWHDSLANTEYAKSFTEVDFVNESEKFIENIKIRFEKFTASCG